MKSPLILIFISLIISLQVRSQTVVDIIVNSPDHTTLEAAVIAAELADDLSGTGPFTVFAPTDAAFAALPAGLVETLLQDPTGDLAQILLYHVVGGTALSTSLSDGQIITTLQGQDVTVMFDMGNVFINDAQVIVADLEAENGVVHVIDAVLVPELNPLPATVVDIIVNSPDHTTLEAAVIAAELADDLSGTGPFTVFAPTDAAFAALPAGLVETLLQDPTGDLAQILLYHVVGGTALSTSLSDGQIITTLQGQDVTVMFDMGNVFINDAQVIVADLEAENGVVHVIDAVLVPELNPLPATVVDIIVNSPDHTTLEAAVIAAELADDLSGTGPFTVFAPTDAAFAALPAGLVETLLQDPTGDLAQILLYHVVGGTALSTSLSDGQIITTLQGQDVTVMFDMGNVFINDAQVIVADLEAENGVVHVIDAVLVPELNPISATVVDIIVNSPDHTTLEAAVIAAELADDLSGTGPFTVFAPTDAAFAALPAGLVETLLQDPTGDLAQILLYHVVSGTALSTSLSDGQIITTLQGQDVTVTIDMGNVFINDAQVIVADLEAENGVVHVIDAVLVPELNPLPATVVDIIVNSPDHTTLEAAVIAAELADDLSGTGPFTVFAPTDAAFAALPAGLVETLLQDPTGDLAQILLYHVVGGTALSTSLSDGQIITTLQGQDVTVMFDMGNVFINDAQVIVADLEAENGVVHVIDAVLVPELNPLPATVVDIIVNSPDHTTLEAAVIAAELADDLSGTGPFTVFAPTDAAFAALPAGVLESLLEDPTGTLAQILLYHVVGANALSTSLSDGQTITTLQGEEVVVNIDGGNVFINNAQVIVADLVAENGVVHVIDAVLSIPTSTVEYENSAISVFPVPAQDVLNVVGSFNSDVVPYVIYDQFGRMIKSGNLNSGMSQIDLEVMHSGIYQISIGGEEKQSVVSFVKL
ncbi:MAG: fasciclin domain-containing protein [Flavobacteriales bacterium]|nr:fasciclin domain-containing protein [Flavobacteriales bacterium]